MKRPEDMSRDELEDEVIYLRSELRVAEYEHEVTILRSAGVGSPMESAIAIALFRAAPRALSLNTLLDLLEERGSCASDIGRNLKVHISRLRRSLGREAIHTLWGQGYGMSPVGVLQLAELGLEQRPVVARAA